MSQQTFKHAQARKNVVYGGAAIMVCITLLSCVSSFQIFRPGFADFPALIQNALAFFAVCIVEGAFTWLVYGFTRAFASALERLISLAGIAFLIGVMLLNIATHAMQTKGIPLHPFQITWLSWGAIMVFGAVLLVVLAITLADPIVRVGRLEMRYHGRQQEAIITAKADALESERILLAMAERAEIEAEQLAEKIIGPGRQLTAGPAAPAPGDKPVVAWRGGRMVEDERSH